MARRLLTGKRSAAPRALALLLVVLGLGLAIGACQKHGESQSGPAPAASGSAADGFADDARAAHFAAEKARAEARWSAQPRVEECAKVLHEDGDAALCKDAQNALSAILQLDASAPTDRWLRVLADGSVVLARLSQRARYQSLVDLSQHRTTGDAGVADAFVSPLTGPTSKKHTASAAKHEQHALELTDSPATQFMAVALRLERDSLRDLGAYLEYAPLGVRQAAFGTVKKLRDAHPQWPLLDHLIREASLLETDLELKRELSELIASGLPRAKRLQATDSK